jgi:hypothetical protein
MVVRKNGWLPIWLNNLSASACVPCSRPLKILYRTFYATTLQTKYRAHFQTNDAPTSPVPPRNLCAAHRTPGEDINVINL